MDITDFITVKRVTIAQGVYYIAAAIWPVVSRSSFWRILGPEYPLWLVLTMSFLIASIGFALLACLMIDRGIQDVGLLGLSAAIMLIVSDTWFVATRSIGPLYLFDVAIQGMIIYGWISTFDWESAREAWKNRRKI